MSDEAFTVPIKEWIALHSRLGMAEGLLHGWIMQAGDDQSRCIAATERFLSHD